MRAVNANAVFNSNGRANTKYDWTKLLDGSTWELTPGEDFKVDVNDFRTMAYNAAARHGKKVRTANRDGCFYLQAYEVSA